MSERFQLDLCDVLSLFKKSPDTPVGLFRIADADEDHTVIRYVVQRSIGQVPK